MQRVTEQLLRLAVDQPAAPPNSGDSSSSSSSSSSRQGRDQPSRHALSSPPTTSTASAAFSSAPLTMMSVDPARAVAALTRAYDSGEKYADVRTAVAQSLPRVKNAADFVLSCVQRLASPSFSPSNPSSIPLVQLMLEALSLGEACVVPAPRPVFAAVDGAATRVNDPAARARAARWGEREDGVASTIP